MKKIFKKLMLIMPKGLAHKILYRKVMHKKLNLKNPKDLNEKIHWLMVNEYDEKYGELADKYKVRDYISKKGFENILPKLYGVYNNSNEIDFEKFPDKFVIKPNNGCGNIFICLDKKNFDFETCKLKLNSAVKKSFSSALLEYHYKYIEPKIICEEYLDDGNGKNPNDYKFFCFNGKVECCLVCSDRSNGNYRDYFDKEWNYLDYTVKERHNPKCIKKPSNYEEMIKIAEELSKEFKFVRVDLYSIKGKTYFSELTFSPAAGMNKNLKQDALDYLGSLIKL